MRLAHRTSTCLSRVQIEEIVSGGCADAALVGHLAACSVCRAKADAVRRDNELVAELRRSHLDSVPGDATATPDGGVPGYEILREVHRGAQGVVFEAIQSATKRRVALKTIARGRFATTRQRVRFEREIEIVASLRHPNIVMLYESGVTGDGGAYFAMEYVDGVTLQEHRDWRAVPPRETARLLVRICQAVGYAHQHGVIHRDLKPGNILVDQEGEPRVLDFGLARLPQTDDDHEISAEVVFAGTFAYASPEQLLGPSADVDIRSDVYSLGLILYEMLTGTGAHCNCTTLPDLIAARRNAPPASPRATRAEVDRDLETIVLKALAPDQGRRYRSAADLGEDLERYLDGRPILSRQDSLGYVLVKLIQRRRRVMLVSSVVAAVMGGLLIFTLLLFLKHEREQDKAMDTLVAFQRVLEVADPLSGLSSDTPLHAFLNHIDRNVQHHLVDQPEAAASIHTTLGQLALNMADYLDAHTHFAVALSLREQVLDEGDPAMAESMHNLGRAVFFLGRYEEAASLYRHALDRRTAVLGATHLDVANTMSHLASCLRRLGDGAQAEELLQRALSIRESDAGATSEEVAAGLNNLGSLFLETGRLDLALAHFQRALTMIEQAAGTDDWRVAHALRNRAACLNTMGRHAEAEADLLRAEGIWQAVVGPDHPALARVQLELARTSLHLNHDAQAEALIRSAAENNRARLGGQHPELADSLELLGLVLKRQGRYEEALLPLEQALQIRRDSTPSNEGLLVSALTLLGQDLTEMHRFEEAEQLLLEAFAAADLRADVRREQMAATLNALVDLYERWGRLQDAETYRADRARRGLAGSPVAAEGETTQSDDTQP